MRSLIAALALAGCSQDQFANTIDPCRHEAVAAAVDASPADRAAFGSSLAMWRGAAGADLTLVEPGAAAALSLRFVDTALFLGRYDDRAMAIELARGVDPGPLAVVLAHELGHAFGLYHVDPVERASVMNAGNTSVTPTSADADALAGLWGRCATTSRAAP